VWSPEAVKALPLEIKKEGSLLEWNVSMLSAKNTSNGFENVSTQNFSGA